MKPPNSLNLLENKLTCISYFPPSISLDANRSRKKGPPEQEVSARDMNGKLGIQEWNSGPSNRRPHLIIFYQQEKTVTSRPILYTIITHVFRRTS